MAQSSKTLYVGVDVHKESIAVADAPEDHGGEVDRQGLKQFATPQHRGLVT